MYLNPYLFLLLKKLIKLEVEAILHQKPTILQITEYVNKEETKYTSATAEYIRKAWSRKSFRVNTRALDVMADLLQIYGHFSSWDDFYVFECSKCPECCKTGRRYSDIPFNELSIKEQQIINALVDKRAAEIVLSAHGGDSNYLFPPDLGWAGSGGGGAAYSINWNAVANSGSTFKFLSAYTFIREFDNSDQ